MTSLGQTARGVLCSVLALAALLATATWLLGPSRPVNSTIPPVAASTPTKVRHGDLLRVALAGRAVSSVRLRIDGPFCVSSLSRPDESVTDEHPLQELSVAGRAEGIRLRGRLFRGEGIEIVPRQSPGVWLDGRKYRGAVRLHVTNDGRLWPVNVLALEEYLAAVVDAEMPSAFPPAAREAQAIAARTYAVSCLRDPPHPWFDLYSTPVSQNYLGVVYAGEGGKLLAGETESGRRAVAATAGLVCTHEGRLFRTYYSACCGGRTLSGADVFGDGTPTLAGIECGGCDGAPLFRWQRRHADAAAFSRLARSARTRQPSFGSVRTAASAPEAESPRGVTLSDGRRTVQLSATEVKSALGLPSLDYELTADAELIVATGRGHGHCVGLCQWGAKGLAEKGLSAEQILKHYYPGCEVSRLESSGAKLVRAGGIP